MSIQKMPKSGGQAKPVDKPVDSVHKSKAAPVDKLKKNQARKPKSHKKTGKPKGGYRPGAGRPQGSVSITTMERLAAKRAMIGRITEATDGLLNAQLNKAKGEQYLMCRTETGKGRDRKVTVEVVTDIETIKKYFIDDGITINQRDGEDNQYFYVSTKPADNMAIQSLFDRAYGKATEKVELGGKDEGDLAELEDDDLDARISKYLERRQRTK